MHLQIFVSVATGMQALVWSPVAHDDGRVMLYLHGSGGFGTGLAGLYEYQDLPSLLRDGLDLTCRVVIPSCHLGEHWQPDSLEAFLADYAAAHGRPLAGYDLLGYSRGGTGAYRLAATVPARIRSVAVVAAPCALELVPRLALTPVLICHGRDDPKIDVAQARAMHDALRAIGGNCTLSVVPADHFIIAQVLGSGALFAWQRAVA